MGVNSTPMFAEVWQQVKKTNTRWQRETICLCGKKHNPPAGYLAILLLTIHVIEKAEKWKERGAKPNK